ncbi:MAG TPA: TerB family tellurite resistance protein [Povalibacter sp.]
MSFADQLKRIFGAEPAAGLLQVRDPLDLAIAALLIELARADFSESAAEFTAIQQLLGRRFGMDQRAVDDLLARAVQRADRAVSLHEFTHRLNSELPEADKLAIVEMLWQVSHADGHIDKHEEHLIRRVAGLLHVSDRDRIRLKLKTIVDG